MRPWVSKVLSGSREVIMFILAFLQLCWPVIVLGLSVWLALRRLR
jgi:hypothetical protein